MDGMDVLVGSQYWVLLLVWGLALVAFAQMLLWYYRGRASRSR